MYLEKNKKPRISVIIQTPDFFIEYLTQNVIFHVKSHVTKHAF